jgi:hypothetical protein
MRSFFGLLILLVGGFVMYKVLPVYWGDFKLHQLLNEQAVNHTYTRNSEQEIANSIVEKARNFNVVLSPEQIKVQRSPEGLAITAEYSVHVDMPIYPLDLNFKTASKNQAVIPK